MLKIRAHHLLCIPRYYSKGYNKEFAKRHKEVCMSIRENPSQKIKILRKLDNLCAKCPHKKGNACAKTPDGQNHVMWLDAQVLKRLGIKENSVHVARDIFNLSMDKIPNVKGICGKCSTYYKSCIGGKDHTGINNSFKEDIQKLK